MKPSTNLPDALYIRGSAGGPLSGSAGGPLPPIAEGKNRHVTLQWEAGIDPRLKHLDVRVLFILRGSQWTERPIDLGSRKIAKYACAGRRQVTESLKRLHETGWIDVLPGGRGDRARYRVAPVKFAAAKEVVPAAGPKIKPKVQHELVSCPICHTRCRQILKVGWCRKCNWKREVGKVVDARLAQEKTA